MKQMYYQAKQAAPNKKVIITETGSSRTIQKRASSERSNSIIKRSKDFRL